MNLLLSSEDIQAEQCQILSKKFIDSKLIQFHDPSKWSINITPKIQKRVSEPGKKGRTLEVTLPKTNMTNWKKTIIWRCVCHETYVNSSLPCDFFLAGQIFKLPVSSNWISSPESVRS